MILSRSKVNDFFNPWPVILPKGRYGIYLESLNKVKKYKCFWDPKLSIGEAAHRIKTNDWLGKRHQVESIAIHTKSDKPIIIVSNNIILDGNHRICALINKKHVKNKYVLVIKRIKEK